MFLKFFLPIRCRAEELDKTNCPPARLIDFITSKFFDLMAQNNALSSNESLKIFL